MNDLGSVPLAPGAWPALGHLAVLARDPLAFLSSLPAHGDLLRIRLGPVSAVVVCDPELTRTVLIEDRTFDKGGPLFDRAREIAGNGLVTCLHDEHRRQRRLAQPAFHRSRLPGYADVMTDKIIQTTGRWREGQIVDVPAAMMDITATVTMSTLFSAKLAGQIHSEMLEDVRTIIDNILWRMIMPPPLDRLPTRGNIGYWRSRNRLRRTIDALIAERRADGTDHGDLLSALLAARDVENSSEGLTDAEVSNMLITFSIGGIETTATTLAWALHLISQNPLAEKRLHDEVDTVLAGRPARYPDVPKLEYTQRVITETLRLFSPIQLITRRVTTDTRLGGHVLPAGTPVVYSPHVIHHRADFYPDPEAFDPDRWSPLATPPPPNTYIPFGGGARKCIGDTFGVIEATLALATIATRWRLSGEPGQVVRPARAVAPRPHKLRMRTTSRVPGRAVGRRGGAPGPVEPAEPSSRMPARGD
ncbi:MULTISPECIES: cytochrome P450 [unclassified Parafrankia]|uniref:cytochrome P450 n=1 Tax=unclassified Parafrankia TaxID=2994368 RepID=UPI000DA431F5|nr:MULTISPECIES: cytochrome P450 [unclassified Parafrankia]TCJ31696.1 cytochrome P450 [Parafrankia sp. BMG5.11]SQE00590.1 Pentalenene oxygenase [Parafrankia sp. Ea1.12]